MATSADPGALVRATPVGSPFRFRARRLLTGLAAFSSIILAGIVLPACDDAITGTPTPYLTVSPTGPITLEVGQTAQISASVTNSTGAVTFASSSNSVASVSSSGLVTAASPGTTTITATVAGTPLRASVQIVVTGPTVEDLSGNYSVTLEPVQDPSAHDPHVFNAGTGRDAVLNVEVAEDAAGAIAVKVGARQIGPSTLPELTGAGAQANAEADAVAVDFELTGQGTIAGFSNVTVTATGSADDTGLFIRMVVGANGELPTGEPIIYEARGPLQP